MRRGLLLVAGAAITWGLWAVFLRPSGLEGPQSALILFLVTCLPLPFVARAPAVTFDRRLFGWLVALGIADALNATLYFAAVRRGPIAIGVLCHYLAPLLVALAAPLFGEPPSRRALAGMPIAAAGLALLVGATVPFPLVTALLGACSAVFYAGLVFCAKALSRRLSALQIAAFHGPISALLVFALCGRAAWPVHATSSQWIWALAGALVCGLGATVLFNAGLSRSPVQPASALTYLEPLTAAVVGAVAFSEPLGLRAAVGALLILTVGAWVVLEPPRALASRP